MVIEALRAGGHARCTQLIVEVLIVNMEGRVLPIYPALPGLTFNVKWTPQFAAMPTQVMSNMANIDLALSNIPIHEFELNYDFLRDGVLWNTGSSEFKTMMGFFLQIGGPAGRFLFKNPDDFTVAGQAIGTTDGVTSVWTIQRTFGAGGFGGTEPVGFVDTGSTVNVYLDGTLQSPSTYDIVTTQPGLQQLKFHSTPATGHAITMDFNYWYYCKFSDGNTTFEKFLDHIWLTSSIKIRTCLAGA